LILGGVLVPIVLATVIKHVTKRLRQHWRNTRIVWRGDSHYGRVEAMEWAEDNGADYIFGLAGNPSRVWRRRRIRERLQGFHDGVKVFLYCTGA
jgi:hypothetical protein